MSIFYDSTKPEHIPANATRAALYFDGIFAPDNKAQAHRFQDKRWITIHFDYRNCSIIDFEKGNPCFNEPTGLRIFAAGRRKMNMQARIYVDRADMRRAWDGLGSEAQHVLWWIPTADDRDWTPEQLATNIHEHWNVPGLRAEKIWANQNVWNNAAGWDRSNLFMDF